MHIYGRNLEYDYIHSELGPNSGINLFRIKVYIFLTDTCKGIIKSSEVRKFCPNSKFPDKSSAGLTRFDRIRISFFHLWILS